MAIGEALENDLFAPYVIALEAANSARLRQHPDIGKAALIKVNEHGAEYTIEYDWHITDGQWARPQAPVTAIKTRAADGHCSLFVTGPDGRAWTNYWPKPDTTDWLGSHPIGDTAFPEGAPVTAIKTRETDGYCSLFVTGFDGRVWTNYWPKPDSTDWAGWHPIGEQDKAFPEGAPITAIKTREADGHCSLFATGSDGRVWANYWPKPDTTDWAGWHSLGDNTLLEGAPVTAIKTREIDGHCSLFVTGFDGNVWTNYWPKPDSTEWAGWPQSAAPTSPTVRPSRPSRRAEPTVTARCSSLGPIAMCGRTTGRTRHHRLDWVAPR